MSTGKLTINGLQLPSHEQEHLHNIAKRSAKKHAEWEKTQQFERIPTTKGYILRRIKPSEN